MLRNLLNERLAVRKELSEQQLNELSNSVIVYGKVKDGIKTEIKHYAQKSYQKGVYTGTAWGLFAGIFLAVFIICLIQIRHKDRQF